MGSPKGLSLAGSFSTLVSKYILKMSEIRYNPITEEPEVKEMTTFQKIVILWLIILTGFVIYCFNRSRFLEEAALETSPLIRRYIKEMTSGYDLEDSEW